MIPRQPREPRSNKEELEFWTASYDDIRYITAHETADMICQILSGDGVYYDLGLYTVLYRDTQQDIISEKRYPKGTIQEPKKYNPILKDLGFNDVDIVLLLEKTTAKQRKAIKNLVSFGLTAQEIKEQMKL